MKKDGWVELGDCAVYVEDGNVVRATVKDSSAAVYKWEEEYNCYNNVLPLKYETFRRGWREGRYTVR
jgi:hypothetical protein